MTRKLREEEIQAVIQQLLASLSARFIRLIFTHSGLETLERTYGKTTKSALLCEYIVREQGLNLLPGRPGPVSRSTTSIHRKSLEKQDEQALREAFRPIYPAETMPASTTTVARRLAEMRWIRGSENALTIYELLSFPSVFAGM